MTRIHSFERKIANSAADCEAAETDVMRRWKHRKTDVVVSVIVKEYPRPIPKMTPNGVRAVHRGEYWLKITGTGCMDGAGPDAPFDSVYSSSEAAFEAAWALMEDIGDDYEEATPAEEPPSTDEPAPESDSSDAEEALSW